MTFILSACVCCIRARAEPDRRCVFMSKRDSSPTQLNVSCSVSHGCYHGYSLSVFTDCGHAQCRK